MKITIPRKYKLIPNNGLTPIENKWHSIIANAIAREIVHLCTKCEDTVTVFYPESHDEIVKCNYCNEECPSLIRLAYHMGVSA